MTEQEKAMDLAAQEVAKNGFYSYEYIKDSPTYGFVFLFNAVNPSEDEPMPTGLPVVACVKSGKLMYVKDEDTIFSLLQD